MTLKQLQNEIIDLKKNSDLTILAHYYQPIEIQQIADFLGDSLGLSRIAKDKTNTKYIIFAGVTFMAETASIINQDKHVLVPSQEACCELAAFLNPEIIKNFKREYPNLPVITYVNSTAEVKAESDICCTSSNCGKIVQEIKNEFKSDAVLFGPDANLGDYAQQITGIETIKMPQNGHCYVHSQLTNQDIIRAKKNYPKAKVLVHPECIREVREIADFAGSTAQMYNFVKDNQVKFNKYIIGTEKGLRDRLAFDFPELEFFSVNNNLICNSMKKNSLEQIKYLIENPNDERYEIRVPQEIAEKAMVPIEKMLKYS
jgi:quinolinate synthase